MKDWLSTARRARDGILQAVGGYGDVEDTDFDVRSRKFSEQSNEIHKVHEAMQIWLDAFDSFSAANVLLSAAFKQFYADTAGTNNQTSPQVEVSYGDVATIFEKISVEMHRTIRPAIKDIFINRCLRPTESILALVPLVNEDIQARKSAKAEFDIYSAKIRKECTAGKDFTHPHVAKITCKLEESSKLLATTQSKLYESFDEFELNRPSMLGQELAASLACIHHSSSSCTALLNRVLPLLPQCASSMCLLSLSHPPPTQLLSEAVIYSLRKSRASQAVATRFSRSRVCGGYVGGYSRAGLPLAFPNSSSNQDTSIADDFPIPGTGSFPTSSLSIARHSMRAPPLMRGYMFKKGETRRNWNQRYFVLMSNAYSGSKLTYYKWSSESIPYGKDKKGELDLTNYSLVVEGDIFVLRGSVSDMREFKMEIKNDAEYKQKWITALGKHLEYNDQMVELRVNGGTDTTVVASSVSHSTEDSSSEAVQRGEGEQMTAQVMMAPPAKPPRNNNHNNSNFLPTGDTVAAAPAVIQSVVVETDGLHDNLPVSPDLEIVSTRSDSDEGAVAVLAEVVAKEAVVEIVTVTVAPTKPPRPSSVVINRREEGQLAKDTEEP